MALRGNCPGTVLIEGSCITHVAYTLAVVTVTGTLHFRVSPRQFFNCSISMGALKNRFSDKFWHSFTPCLALTSRLTNQNKRDNEQMHMYLELMEPFCVFFQLRPTFGQGYLPSIVGRVPKDINYFGPPVCCNILVHHLALQVSITSCISILRARQWSVNIKLCKLNFATRTMYVGGTLIPGTSISESSPHILSRLSGYPMPTIDYMYVSHIYFPHCDFSTFARAIPY